MLCQVFGLQGIIQDFWLHHCSSIQSIFTFSNQFSSQVQNKNINTVKSPPLSTILSYSLRAAQDSTATRAHCHIWPRTQFSVGLYVARGCAAPLLCTTLLFCHFPHTNAESSFPPGPDICSPWADGQTAQWSAGPIYVCVFWRGTDGFESMTWKRTPCLCGEFCSWMICVSFFCNARCLCIWTLTELPTNRWPSGSRWLYPRDPYCRRPSSAWGPCLSALWTSPGIPLSWICGSEKTSMTCFPSLHQCYQRRSHQRSKVAPRQSSQALLGFHLRSLPPHVVHCHWKSLPIHLSLRNWRCSTSSVPRWTHPLVTMNWSPLKMSSWRKSLLCLSFSFSSGTIVFPACPHMWFPVWEVWRTRGRILQRHSHDRLIHRSCLCSRSWTLSWFLLL